MLTRGLLRYSLSISSSDLDPTFGAAGHTQEAVAAVKALYQTPAMTMSSPLLEVVIRASS